MADRSGPREDASAVAIIPARAGSKRLRRKNVRVFLGKPMLAWTIEIAFESGRFDEVIVTTEDDAFGALAEDHGATWLRRPQALAGDDVGLGPVSAHALSELAALPEHFCLLMPNCPLRNLDDIDGVRRSMIDSRADAAMSVVAYGWRRPEWALYRDGPWLRGADGRDALADLDRSAGLVCPTGVARWAVSRRFLENPTFYPDRLSGHAAPWFRAIDIDLIQDFELAECVGAAMAAGFAFTDER